MRRSLLVSIVVLCTIICSCEQKRSEFKIYPLSPYSDVIQFSKDEDISKDMRSGLKTQYYIVDESIDYTDKTKNRLQNFIEMNLKSDINGNKSIYFTFYKGGFSFNRNSIQTKDQLVNDHANDKLAEFEYVDGKLYNFDFYKDGSYYTPPVEDKGQSDNSDDNQ
jgi:hypothetical protein